jgi:hypothetical protein
MRVAVLTHDMVQRRRGKWTKKDVQLWLADQGFDLKRYIGKAHNWKTKSFHFVQTER